MSERRRLAITLDPSSDEPARFKNKRVQVSEEYSSVRGESEAKVVPVTRPSSAKSNILCPITDDGGKHPKHLN